MPYPRRQIASATAVTAASPSRSQRQRPAAEVGRRRGPPARVAHPKRSGVAVEGADHTGGGRRRRRPGPSSGCGGQIEHGSVRGPSAGWSSCPRHRRRARAASHPAATSWPAGVRCRTSGISTADATSASVSRTTNVTSEGRFHCTSTPSSGRARPNAIPPATRVATMAEPAGHGEPGGGELPCGVPPGGPWCRRTGGGGSDRRPRFQER